MNYLLAREVIQDTKWKKAIALPSPWRYLVAGDEQLYQPHNLMLN